VMPLVLLITLPLMAMLIGLVQDPHSLLAVVMSWIPIYTPFAMLARLGGGVTAIEAIGTAALLLGFLVAEFVLLGRVFRQSLLRAGQPPRLAGLVRLMLARQTP
jgi:ABC-2 type transport system permease protein